MVLSRVPSNNIFGSLLVLRHTGGNCPPALCDEGRKTGPDSGCITSDSGSDLIDQTLRPEPTLSSASTEPIGGITDILHRDDGHCDSDR